MTKLKKKILGQKPNRKLGPNNLYIYLLLMVIYVGKLFKYLNVFLLKFENFGHLIYFLAS